MTAAELIAQLSKLPPDTEVVLAADAEGNGFETISIVEPARWEGDAGCLVWNDAGDEHEPIDGSGGTPCVVLWP